MPVRSRSCGRSNRHGAWRELHTSLYLVHSRRGKLRQLSVPKAWELRVRQAANNYQGMRRIIEEISEMEWKRLVGGQPAQAPALLGRLITYSEKIFGSAEQILATISDRREKPRIPTAVSLEAVLAMFWARFGNLNGPEARSPAQFWKRWVGRGLCSVATIGRAQAVVSCHQFRGGSRACTIARNKTDPCL